MVAVFQTQKNDSQTKNMNVNVENDIYACANRFFPETDEVFS